MITSHFEIEAEAPSFSPESTSSWTVDGSNVCKASELIRCFAKGEIKCGRYSVRIFMYVAVDDH
ncbi:hypothetical protein O0535_05290 [Brevibacillus halotolerans]|uniref:Uncharacterized protein n=1 Tax=Brevibacillus halotolerans TaxID=1507437 RepID=A0ABT4HTV0_9BACL|nr:hypothetical protein [Brevibacillus halotolerans]